MFLTIVFTKGGAISKNTIYKTAVKPVVRYMAEKMFLTTIDKEKLQIKKKIKFQLYIERRKKIGMVRTVVPLSLIHI